MGWGCGEGFASGLKPALQVGEGGEGAGGEGGRGRGGRGWRGGRGGREGGGGFRPSPFSCFWWFPTVIYRKFMVFFMENLWFFYGKFMVFL